LLYLAVIGIGTVGVKDFTRPEDYHHVSGPYILDGVSATRRISTTLKSSPDTLISTISQFSDVSAAQPCALNHKELLNLGMVVVVALVIPRLVLETKT